MLILVFILNWDQFRNLNLRSANGENNIQNNLIEDDLYYIPHSFVGDKQYLQEGDILLSLSSGSKKAVGKATLIKENGKGTFGTFCGVLRPKRELVNPLFLSYFFKTSNYRENISDLAGGVNINNISKGHFSKIFIPLPPMNEQLLIIDVVEKLLARVNTVKERLDRVPTIMQQFRQSVLAAACSGELTEKWRERNQCENSSEFLECVNVDYPYELPPTWKIVKLYDIAAKEKYSITDGPFGSNLKTEHYTESGPRVIRLQNIGNGQFLNLFSHISQEHYETLNKHHIFPSDLVIALLGDPIPRCCIIPDDIGPAIVKADCVRFKPNNDLVNSKFVMYAINEPNIRELIKESVHGVARPRLNLKQIKSLLLPLPPLEEQYEIVHRLDVLFTHANRIEDQVTAARERVETVTQSILHQAFTGNLLPSKDIAES